MVSFADKLENKLGEEVIVRCSTGPGEPVQVFATITSVTQAGSGEKEGVEVGLTIGRKSHRILVDRANYSLVFDPCWLDIRAP